MEERKDFEDMADLNVVILPDEKTSHAIIAWSELIASCFPTAYTLNGRDILPHLSLYAARYPDRNQDAIEKIVDDLVAHCEAFNVTLSGFSVFSGYIFYDAVLHKKLKALHEAIVDALNPLREGQVSDNQRQQTGLTVEQQRAIEKYGYVSVKNLYMPHISITRMVHEKDANVAISLLPTEQMVFKVQTIAIASYAAYGTCPQPLRTFSLKAPHSN